MGRMGERFREESFGLVFLELIIDREFVSYSSYFLKRQQQQQQQQQRQQASQTAGSLGTPIAADPPSHDNSPTAASSGVELDNLGSAANPNDISTTPKMSSTTSPGGQPSAPKTPSVADTVLPQTASPAAAAATASDAAPGQSPANELKPVPPSIQITLLLITGARHPYKIDERYLRKRDVSFTDNDPFTISVYTLKELIWKDWREEWEPRPTNPSSIRLIQFGRLLEDKAQLKDCRFNTDSPNVLHMSVKPQEVVDDEDAAKAKHGLGNGREGSLRSTGCRCVIL
ncbi:MAG: hypothetical protein M1840_000650 [Geoglossum simile]|nr:MAG: hypothetical protein M1840_000650 [Geoglossum simile]